MCVCVGVGVFVLIACAWPPLCPFSASARMKVSEMLKWTSSTNQVSSSWVCLNREEVAREEAILDDSGRGVDCKSAGVRGRTGRHASPHPGSFSHAV